ncbi:MSMEG_4193 family putative phosphomutase [Luteococcus sp. Sow4_B9]|uniref:MSMEG_4193 family putative phosphomutase n=1 Tax=Luteococcus sp. Sow4_B9 TaxID=3438792 RepID=UPI003F9B3086
MVTLLLARHGRSTSNTAGTLSGRTPGIELDEHGRGQALALGKRLRGLDLQLAVHSPLERCRQTLELAMEAAELEPQVREDPRVTECDYGEWSNRKLSELAGEALWRQVQDSPSTVTFPGGESMQEMASRMVRAVEATNQQLAESAGADAAWLLVGHGDPIKAVLSHALGQPLDEFQRIVVDPASVSIVRWPVAGESAQGRKPMVVAMNTTQGAVSAMIGAPAGPQLGGGLGSQSA